MKRISLQFELSSRISGILSNTFCQIRCQKRTSRGRPPNTQAPRPSPLPSSWRQRQPFIHLCWKQRAFCIEAGLCAVLCLVCIAKPWLYPSSSSHHAKPHNLCGHPAKITSKWCAWRKSITHHATVYVAGGSIHLFQPWIMITDIDYVILKWHVGN